MKRTTTHQEMHLPPNFQEVLMSTELTFQSKIDDDIIRKLLYLYSVLFYI